MVCATRKVEVTFTKTRVCRGRTIFPVGNVVRKPENFSQEQVDALRAALRAWNKRQSKPLTQAEIAKRLTDLMPRDQAIGQQTAGRYLSAETSVGMSWAPARAIALLCDYDGLDAFFEAHGLASGKRSAPNTGDARHGHPHRAPA